MKQKFIEYLFKKLFEVDKEIENDSLYPKKSSSDTEEARRLEVAYAEKYATMRAERYVLTEVIDEYFKTHNTK